MENIIIYRLGSLGDTVVALPCFHLIARSFPFARRIVLTNVPVSSKAAPLEVILGESGLIHEAMAYPLGLRSPLKLWKLARQLWALKATTLIYLMPPRGRLVAIRDFIFFRSCGIKRIVGLSVAYDLQNHRVSGDYEEPEYQRLARSLLALGQINHEDRSAWDLLLTEEELAVGRRTVWKLEGAPFIAINMGGKAVEKDWGAKCWRSLLDRLARSHSSYGLLAVGAAEESMRVQSVANNWPGKFVDACGQLSPRETAAALKFASIFIGHDSGPLHLAASSAVACIGLFGNYNRPKKWHPYGDMHRIIHRMEGMSAISVDEVESAVNSLLPSPGSARNGGVS